MEAFSRTRLLLGDTAMEKLNNARVAVFGLGGVGGYVAEALARSGIGSLELIDHDTISLTNLNRQVLATHSTIGMDKAEAAQLRALDINPDMDVIARKTFFGPDTMDEFDFSKYNYIVDAIDTVTGKLALVEAAQKAGVPILSSMGTGNKLNPTELTVADIYETSVCPLARVMRYELKKRNIDSLKVVYSPEKPQKVSASDQTEETKKPIPGSNPFVPPVAGLIIASEVIKDLLEK